MKKGYIKFLPPHPLGRLSSLPGKIIKPGEEHQVVKRGREYRGCGEEYNKEKRENNIIFPFYIKAVKKIIKLGRGRKFKKDLKHRDGKEYQVLGNFIQPCLKSNPHLEHEFFRCEWMLSVQGGFKQGFPVVTLYTNLGEDAVKHGLQVQRHASVLWIRVFFAF